MFFFFLEEDTSTGSYTSPFDSIKQLDDEGNEYWYARDLQGILEYSEWRNFYKIIEKAKNACEASGHVVQSEFVDVNKFGLNHMTTGFTSIFCLFNNFIKISPFGVFKYPL